ncbi:amidohydrolase family protein [Nonomuraea sp. NPDC005692]|uniref:amidohydrolase family protein n=1 Tax=Nonomuraea sp. NPDC005692 TaxID=3157168 RepID=UPI0033F8AAB3
MNHTFRGPRVVDGSGRPSYRADVVTKAGMITEITEPGQATAGAGRVMDVDGLVLAPGFIDMHAHSDLALLTDPHHVAKAAQGVTLEVLGQDGLGYAPVDDTTLRQLRIQLAGWNGDPEDVDWDWRTVGGYLDRLDEGIAVNAAYLIPHGTVRALVLGWENRPPTSGELDMMRELVAEGMRQGAVGMSSGLT